MTTRPDLDGLKALAEQATPGPWRMAGVDKFSDEEEHHRVVAGRGLRPERGREAAPEIAS